MKHKLCSYLQVTTFGILSVASIGSVQAGSACHVSEAGTGNGSSWSQTIDLTTALADPGCSEIWVKQGTYYPTSGTDRNVSFVIDRAVRLLGGFEGTESMLSQRVPGAYPTILSGNIGDINDETDNSYHVVFVDGTTANGPITTSTEINGFTITQGYGEVTGVAQNTKGAGLYCDGTNAECSPSLDNLTFIDNTSRYGAALYISGYGNGVANPEIKNSSFILNQANLFGGAVYNDGYSGSVNPSFENVTFFGNEAMVSGAVHTRGWIAESYPSFNHTTFYLNAASNSGGAIGASTNENNPSVVLVTNSIFWGNSAVNNDPIAYMSHFSVIFEYSVLESGCPANSACSDTTSSDPLLSPLGDHGGFTETLLPGANGSAVDSALAGDCTSSDQRGVLRPQGSGCDMGAVELTELDNDIIFKNSFEDDM